MTSTAQLRERREEISREWGFPADLTWGELVDHYPRAVLRGEFARIFGPGADAARVGPGDEVRGRSP